MNAIATLIGEQADLAELRPRWTLKADGNPIAALVIQHNLKRFGSYGDLAATTGLSEKTVGRYLQQVKLAERYQRRLCRGLMSLAYQQGLADDEIWALNEHELLGLRKLNRERVLAEIKRLAAPQPQEARQ